MCKALTGRRGQVSHKCRFLRASFTTATAHALPSARARTPRAGRAQRIECSLAPTTPRCRGMAAHFYGSRSVLGSLGKRTPPPRAVRGPSHPGWPRRIDATHWTPRTPRGRAASTLRRRSGAVSAGARASSSANKKKKAPRLRAARARPGRCDRASHADATNHAPPRAARLTVAPAPRLYLAEFPL